MSIGVTSQVMKAPANPKPFQPQADKPQSLNGNLKIGPTPTSPPPQSHQHKKPHSTDEIHCHSKQDPPKGPHTLAKTVSQ